MSYSIKSNIFTVSRFAPRRKKEKKKHFNFERLEIWFSSFFMTALLIYNSLMSWRVKLSVDEFSGTWQTFNKLIIWLDRNLHLLIVFLSFILGNIWTNLMKNLLECKFSSENWLINTHQNTLKVALFIKIHQNHKIFIKKYS